MAAAHYPPELPEPGEHGGDVWQAPPEASGGRWIDFSANLNPLGPPAGLLEFLSQHLQETAHYPEPYSRSLRYRAAVYYGLSEQVVAVGNGAAEFIFLLCQVLSPRRVLLVEPTFSEYRRAALAAGAEVQTLYYSPDEQFATPIDQLLAELPRFQPDLAFLCNPNNPTGTLTGREELQAIREAMPPGGWLAVDESFLDLVPEGHRVSARPWLAGAGDAEPEKPLAVITSLTKTFSLPGLRLGLLFGPEALVQKINRHRDPWTVNVLAQRGGNYCLQDAEFPGHSASFLEQARRDMHRSLAAIPGLEVTPGSANFILLDLSPAGATAGQAVGAARNQGLLLRDASNFPGLGPGHLRLAVRTPEENQRVISWLAHWLAPAGR